MKKLTNHSRWNFVIVPTVGLAAVLMAGPALAQDQTPPAQPPPPTGQKHEPKTAADFIKHAYQGNQAEVQMGQLANQKSQNPQVKQLAQRLVTDHTKANQQLQTIAQQSNVTLPEKPDRHHEHALKKLEKLSGSQFDQQFATDQVRDHLKDITEYQNASQKIQDPAVKQYIQQTLPVLQEHLQLARQTAQAVGVSPQTLSSLEKKYPQAAGAAGAPSGMQQGGAQGTQPSSQGTQPGTQGTQPGY